MGFQIQIVTLTSWLKSQWNKVEINWHYWQVNVKKKKKTDYRCIVCQVSCYLFLLWLETYFLLGQKNIHSSCSSTLYLLILMKETLSHPAAKNEKYYFCSLFIIIQSTMQSVMRIYEFSDRKQVVLRSLEGHLSK